MPSSGLFLCGDVMTGRGIDQIMAHPVDPTLYERWARSAVDYVDLAERRNGPIPRAVPPEYIWGEALEILDGATVRIVNLETAVTDLGRPWPGKGIHYRMSPANLGVIGVAGIDCCVLANNHVLDWSYEGLSETLGSLADAGLATAGAGEDVDLATRPAIIEPEPTAGGRVVVFALGIRSSGVPGSWSAGEDRPGVAFAESASDRAADTLVEHVAAWAEPGDLIVVSIHWGPNWGYEIPGSHRDLAHRLIDTGAVDIVHGHSSHHPLGIEVHRGRLILYGCGDLVNDYEGIGGHEEYHPDLGIVYLATTQPESGALESLSLIPMRMRRFRLERASGDEVAWLAGTLDRESRPLGVGVTAGGEGRLLVDW